METRVRNSQKAENTMKDPGIYTCPTCNALFTCLQYYHKHVQQHAQINGTVLLCCSYCRFSTENNFQYNWHVMSHTEEPHSCSVCVKNNGQSNHGDAANDNSNDEDSRDEDDEEEDDDDDDDDDEDDDDEEIGEEAMDTHTQLQAMQMSTVQTSASAKRSNLTDNSNGMLLVSNNNTSNNNHNSNQVAQVRKGSSQNGNSAKRVRGQNKVVHVKAAQAEEDSDDDDDDDEEDDDAEEEDDDEEEDSDDEDEDDEDDDDDSDEDDDDDEEEIDEEAIEQHAAQANHIVSLNDAGAMLRATNQTAISDDEEDNEDSDDDDDDDDDDEEEEEEEADNSEMPEEYIVAQRLNNLNSNNFASNVPHLNQYVNSAGQHPNGLIVTINAANALNKNQMQAQNPLQPTSIHQPMLELVNNDLLNADGIICAKGKGKGNRKTRTINQMGGVIDEEGEMRRKFNCSYCGKSFKTKSHLQRHILTHTGEKPYHCNRCGAKFNQSSSLRNHIIALHTKKYPHTCEVCNKGFLMPALLRKHLKSH